MYKNILRESGVYTTVLVVDEGSEYRTKLESKMSKYFEKFVCASSFEDALALHREEKFNLVLIDIDQESLRGFDLINKLQTIDPFQTIFVYSQQTENSSLVINLLNMGVSCFINKSDALESYYQTFAKICKQKCDRKMLMHYIDELERAQSEFYVPKDTVEENDFEMFPDLQEEDDFEFFPTEIAPTDTVADNSLYQDYFHLLDSEDKEDLHDLLTDIDTTAINAFTDDGGDAEYIAKLGSLLMRYGNVLMHYQFFSDMGTAILEFGKVISDESHKISDQAETFHSLINGFCSGLQVFLHEVWEQESKNPKFFNDSIINDATLIKDMILPPVVEEHEDDLVFF